MDRGVLTEEVLSEGRSPPLHYLVGPYKGTLTCYEEQFLDHEWQEVWQGVEVKQIDDSQETYVLTPSGSAGQ